MVGAVKQRTSMSQDTRTLISEIRAAIHNLFAPPERTTEPGPTRRPRQPGICIVCSDLRGCQLDTRNPGCFPVIFKRISTAAIQGCRTCHLLSLGIKYCITSLDKTANITLMSAHGRRAFSNTLRFAVHGRDANTSEPLRQEIEFFTLPSQPSPWPRIGTADIIFGPTNVLHRLTRAQNWLKTCIEKHKECSNKRTSILPRRVIKIIDSKFPPLLQLHESQQEEGEYVCLSHCWGNNTFIVTTTQSIQAHRADIPWLRLPKTFQDAVEITMRLGFRYLWIDSLCILQDCIKDWEEESAKMCQVFGGATLTLFATKAAHGNDGLFDTPDKQDPPLQMLGVDDVTKKFYSVYARRTTGMRHVSDTLPHAELKKKFPLLLRGWVYQERLMSRRILHFGQGEMTWECDNVSICECSGQHAHHRKPTLDRSWHSIVIGYSQLNLTRMSDRLVAISGLATQMKTVDSGRYLAGLWEASLMSDLTWFTTKDSSESLCNVPSWSWASVSSAVTFFAHGYTDTGKSMAKLISINYESAAQEGQNIFDASPTSISLHARVEETYLDANSISVKFLKRFPENGLGRISVAFHPDRDMSSFAGIVFCMRIYEIRTGRSSQCGFLVLDKVESSGPVYRRIGFFTINVVSQIEPWVYPLRSQPITIV